MKNLTFLVALFLFASCSVTNSQSKVEAVAKYTSEKNLDDWAKATLAGGCFWCTEAAFERIEGVKDVISGYSGGEEKNPTYKQVGYGQTGHAEAIQIFYDPAVITYKELLEVFFVAHDPTQLNRQGPDVGAQYRSAIFYHDEEQKKIAEDFMAASAKDFDDPIVTQLVPYEEFWVAEDYHQNFYELNPNQGYVRSVSRPKVEKVMKVFKDKLKAEYRKKS